MCRRGATQRWGWHTPPHAGADLDYPQPLNKPSRLRRLSSHRPWSTPRACTCSRARARAQTRLHRASLSKLARSPPNNDGEEASHFRSTVAYPRVQSRDPAGCGKARCAVAVVPGRDPWSQCPENDVALLRWRESGERAAAACRAIRGRSHACDRARWRCIIKSRSSTL